jgi:hypothetical protein
LSISLGLWLSSCIEETESPQIELTDHSKIATIKTWFEENESSLRVSKSGANYRTGDQELILPFFEKEPDWDKFHHYYFPDGREVYEINLENEQVFLSIAEGDTTKGSLAERTIQNILFVKHPTENRFNPLIVRYYPDAETSKREFEKINYQMIDENWSGEVDLFTYDEHYFMGFVIKEGVVTDIKRVSNSLDEESNSKNLRTRCYVETQRWYQFTITGGFFSGIREISPISYTYCVMTDPEMYRYDPYEDYGDPLRDYSNGNPPHMGPPLTVYSAPKIKLTYHSTLDARTRCVLDKLKTSSFVNNIADFMNTGQTSNTVIKTGITIIPPGSKDPANGQAKDLGNGTYEITISQQNLPDMRALEIARTTIHEIVHVEIFRALKSNGITPMDSNFPKNMDAFLNRYAGNTNDSHHNYMVDRMIPKMAEALMEIHRTQFPNEYNAFWSLASFAYPNGADLNFYKNLFWGGMQGTKAYEKHKESPDFRYLKDLEQLRGYLKLACN